MSEPETTVQSELRDACRADCQVHVNMRSEIARLRRLLARVSEANIAQGCKSTHPRVQLVYDIQEALQ